MLSLTLHRSAGGDFAFAEFDEKDIFESSAWARRIVEVASVTEDAEAINEMHNSVLKKPLYAGELRFDELSNSLEA